MEIQLKPGNSPDLLLGEKENQINKIKTQIVKIQKNKPGGTSHSAKLIDAKMPPQPHKVVANCLQKTSAHSAYRWRKTNRVAPRRRVLGNSNCAKGIARIQYNFFEIRKQ